LTSVEEAWVLKIPTPIKRRTLKKKLVEKANHHSASDAFKSKGDVVHINKTTC